MAEEISTIPNRIIRRVSTIAFRFNEANRDDSSKLRPKIRSIYRSILSEASTRRPSRRINYSDWS